MEKVPTLYVVDAAEPVWLSWVRDTVSFGWLTGAALALNIAIPPSGWLNFILAFVWLTWMLGRSRRHLKQMTADQARAWLDERYPTPTGSKETGE